MDPFSSHLSLTSALFQETAVEMVRKTFNVLKTRIKREFMDRLNRYSSFQLILGNFFNFSGVAPNNPVLNLPDDQVIVVQIPVDPAWDPMSKFTTKDCLKEKEDNGKGNDD